jgi:hypothetical protein
VLAAAFRAVHEPRAERAVERSETV